MKKIRLARRGERIYPVAGRQGTYYVALTNKGTAQRIRPRWEAHDLSTVAGQTGTAENHKKENSK